METAVKSEEIHVSRLEDLFIYFFNNLSLAFKDGGYIPRHVHEVTGECFLDQICFGQ